MALVHMLMLFQLVGGEVNLDSCFCSGIPRIPVCLGIVHTCKILPVRKPPALSSHGFLASAPQVGHRIASTCFRDRSRGFTLDNAPNVLMKAVHFCTID